MLNSGIAFEEYRYLEHGVHPSDISILVELEGIIRANDLESDIQLDPTNKSQIQKLLESNPKILQRPILVSGDEAIIGRPVEKILTLLPSA
tara:strand:- start:518 stop:790 length:273 start_codon:yes stop_codon:yes gene_type:complete